MKKILLLILSVLLLTTTSLSSNINALEDYTNRSGVNINDITDDGPFSDYLSSFFNKRKNDTLSQDNLDNSQVLNPSGTSLINKLKKVENLDGIGHFKKVTYLNIHNGSITNISDDIFELQQLVNINLGRNLKLSGYIPDKFDNLPKLHTFSISQAGSNGNPIHLPDSLFNSESITRINLSNAKITGNIKVPNPQNILDFNNYNTDTTYVPGNILAIDRGRSKIEINSASNKIINVSVEEFEHLEALSKNNKINFNNQSVTKDYSVVNIGKTNLLANDSLFKTIHQINKADKNRIGVTLTIKDMSNNIDYTIDSEAHDLFITNEGIMMPSNFDQYIDSLASNINYQLVLKIDNTIFKNSTYRLPFTINDQITKTVKIVDADTGLSISDDILINGTYKDAVTIDLPTVENYEPLDNVYSLSVELLSNDDLIVEYFVVDREDQFPGLVPEPELPEEIEDINLEENDLDDQIENIIIEESGDKSTKVDAVDTPNTASGVNLYPYLLTIFIAVIVIVLSKKSIKSHK